MSYYVSCNKNNRIVDIYHFEFGEPSPNDNLYPINPINIGDTELKDWVLEGMDLVYKPEVSKFEQDLASIDNAICELYEMILGD